MTTLHLGDCLNGCSTCANYYHQGQAGAVCDACLLPIEYEVSA